MTRVKKKMSRTILLVEDEAPIRDMLSFVLEQAGFTVDEAEDYDVGLTKIKEPYPDLILLDWMMPGGSGVKLAKKLKQHEVAKDIPVIMLTARSEEEDKIRGLEAGADDYITKPFSPKELVARIKAVMRRVTPTFKEEPIEFDGLILEPVSHRVTSLGEPVDMGPTEYKLLHFFMTHPERVYSREQLLDNVCGTNVYVEDRTVDVHIRRLRKAISINGHDTLIQTVRGSGYRFSIKV
jgi:two-component system phosphate regulon response regulator PhoB